jgi:hypothetical protein
VIPIRNVSMPALHQAEGDQRLRSEPIEKKVAPVISVEVQREAGAPATNGSSGIAPQRIKARNVIAAALAGERLTGGRPCSSVIMVSIQRWRLAVITSTAPVERLAPEALGMEDLADFLALAFRRKLDMPLLHAAHLLIFFDLGLGAGIIGGGHREAIGEQIGGAQDQQGLGRKLSAGDTGHHRKSGHRAVDAAIHPVAKIADMRPAPEPPGDVAGVVSMLEIPGVHGAPFPSR